MLHHLWASIQTLQHSVACCSGNSRMIGLWPPLKFEEVFLEIHFSIFKEGCLVFLEKDSATSYTSVSRDKEFPKKMIHGCTLPNSHSFGGRRHHFRTEVGNSSLGSGGWHSSSKLSGRIKSDEQCRWSKEVHKHLGKRIPNLYLGNTCKMKVKSLCDLLPCRYRMLLSALWAPPKRVPACFQSAYSPEGADTPKTIG